MSLDRVRKVILARITWSQLEWLRTNSVGTESMAQVRFLLQGCSLANVPREQYGKRRIIYSDGRVSAWLSDKPGSIANWSQLKPRKLPEKSLGEFVSRGLRGADPLHVELVEDTRSKRLIRKPYRR